MKNLLLLIVFSICAMGLNAQTLEELQTQKADIKAKRDAAQAEANGYASELTSIQDELDKLAGWIKGFGGNIGFDFNNSNNWISNPNPESSSSSLNINLTAFANKKTDGYFWNNKALITKSWQDVDIIVGEDDDLFDQSTVDILNISSLYGKSITKSLALSGLGELNTSLWNFLKPGTLDVGIGLTYTGVKNLVVVVHPLNYHIAFPAAATKDLGIDAQGAFGAKFRADYGKTFMVTGKKVLWSSTLTGFIPYGNKTATDDMGNEFDVELQEYTWLNTLSFEVWKGIGVGLSFGIRNADFEDGPDKSQNYYSLGLSYVL